MAKVISTLSDGIGKLNTLYNGSSTAPTAGEEDYIVWTDLFNIAINLWANEEGVLWRELYLKLSAAPDGTKTVTAGNYSYALPALFKFPVSGYVWTGAGTNKTAFRVIRQEDLQLYENNSGNWCYFLMGPTPTLEFNPNCTLTTGDAITYEYYKHATALATGTDAFEMSDPMFAVYYALSELKKEEGDSSALTIATGKIESMKTRNQMPAYWQESSFLPKLKSGFGV